MSRILIISHKGITGAGQRGNTIEDFQRAADAGVDMIEMDVRRTKDKIFVVHYEEDISGTMLKNITYVTAKGLAHKLGYALPKLADVISAFPRMKFDFEIKEAGYEDAFVDFLRLRLKDKSRYVVSSYNDRSITLVKNKDSEITAGLRLWKTKPDSFIETRVSEFFPYRRVEECHANFLAINWKLLPAGLLWRSEKRGIPVYIWGVDTRTNLKPFLQNRALKGILTEHVEEVRKWLDEFGSKKP